MAKRSWSGGENNWTGKPKNKDYKWEERPEPDPDDLDPYTVKPKSKDDCKRNW